MTLDIYLSKTSNLKPKDIKNHEGFNLISYLLNDDFIKNLIQENIVIIINLIKLLLIQEN